MQPMREQFHKRLQHAQLSLEDLMVPPSLRKSVGNGRLHLNSNEIDLSGPVVPFAVEPGIQTQLRSLQNDLRNPLGVSSDGPARARIVLVSGPTGCGKTSLASWLAQQTGVRLYRLDLSSFQGYPAPRTRQMLGSFLTERGRSYPAILFLDNLQALEADANQAEQSRNTLREFFEKAHDLAGPVLILLATRRPDLLDTEWLQPGRIDQHIALQMPGSLNRLAILRQHTRSLALAFDVNLISLARSANGLSGADLAALCQGAAQHASRNNRPRLGMADFQAAMEQYLLEHTDTHLIDDV
jgi:ATP-dependent 26S proteasome regulatory subunit